MTRKRAFKLLMSIDSTGSRFYVHRVMNHPRYRGKTNAEKVRMIGFGMAMTACIFHDKRALSSAMEVIKSLKGGGRK